MEEKLFSALIEEKFKEYGKDAELLSALVKDFSKEFNDLVERLEKYTETTGVINKDIQKKLLWNIVSYIIFKFTSLSYEDTLKVMEYITKL